MANISYNRLQVKLHMTFLQSKLPSPIKEFLCSVLNSNNLLRTQDEKKNPRINYLLEMATGIRWGCGIDGVITVTGLSPLLVRDYTALDGIKRGWRELEHS